MVFIPLWGIHCLARYKYQCAVFFECGVYANLIRHLGMFHMQIELTLLYLVISTTSLVKKVLCLWEMRLSSDFHLLAKSGFSIKCL